MADLTLSGQCERAMRLVRAGKPNRAIAVCGHILGSFPSHVGTYSILGQAYLESGRHDAATDLFRRVLSADPEDVFSYACLASIHEEQGLLDEAIWHLERAFELSPGHQALRSELRRLYDERDLSPRERVKLTRGALARIHLRGQLYPKAVGELRELIALDPQRVDLRMALAEALWRDGRDGDAASECQSLLVDLPNCLKANLILGAVWLDTEKDEEARALLQRAQSLDPRNDTAKSMFGPHSPLPPREPRLPPMEDQVPAIDLPYLLDEQDTGEAPAQSWDDTLLAEIPYFGPSRPLEGGADTEEAPEPPQAAGVGRLSLIDVRRHYLEEQPDDYSARLDLARRLRDIGSLDEALHEYGYLIEHHYETLPDVIRDLGLLKRLYPGTTDLEGLLARAQERESRRPPQSLEQG